MASQASISIVIPVRDRAGIVGRTLDSVKAQVLRPLDVILVDNASTDNTLETLQRWQRENRGEGFSITLLQEPAPGAAAARNRGLEAGRSPYVLFFDSDDLMAPDLTLSVARLLEAKPDTDIVGWDISRRFLDGKTRTYRFKTRDALYNHIFHSHLATQRYAVRSSFARQVGGWDACLMGWNDYELGVRLLLSRPKVARLGGAPLVQVISQAESITGTGFSQDPRKWERSLDKVSAVLAAAGRSDMLKYIELRRIILSGLYAREGAEGESARLLNEVLGRASGGYYRAVFKFFRAFVARGGRGVAQMAKILCP